MQADDVVADRFVIELEAGAGGMGRVYRTLDRIGGEVVALKVLSAADNASVERFSREAQVLAKLTHPAVVRYVDHGVTAGGERYIAMEWLEGESLSQRLSREPLTMAESLQLARRVAEALSEAHRLGIVHRDIKPSNLFVLGGDVARVKLLDFGIARRLRDDVAITRTGMTVGSWSYMAPEQALGSKKVDARADVFGLGCVLYECIAGHRAFRAENSTAVLAKILLEDPAPLATLRDDVPQELSELVARMLRKESGERPADGAEVAEAIAALGEIRGDRIATPHASAPALTTSEKRVVWVVLASRVSGSGRQPAGEATQETVRDTSARTDVAQSLCSIVEAHGGRLDVLLDGSAIATFSVKGAALDEAPRAARCALAMRAVVPHASMAIAMGLGVVAGHFPVGEVIDLGFAALRASAPGMIRLHEHGASALGPRFEVRSDARGPYLEGEREPSDAMRRLLGRLTTCVGRERELAMLEAVFDECVEDPIARAVVVTGAAGLGKSRLRYELLRRIAERAQPLVLIGRADSVGAGSPFAMLAQALKRWADVGTDDSVDVQRGKLVRKLEPAFAGDATKRAQTAPFLGELCGIRFPEEAGSRLQAARSDARAMGDAMRTAFEDWLAAECARRPVLLVLEDLHWGDLPTVRFVDGALRHLKNAPFMVLAVARPEVREQFPDLWKERQPIALDLGPLTPKASERLVRQVLGDKVSPAVLARIVERAEGNAFYLEELIRTIAEGNGATLPGSVLAMVQARLEALGPDARRVLRAASVFGTSFTRGGVVALLGGSEAANDVDEQLELLAVKEVIQRSKASGGAGDEPYVFRHALVHEATYAVLTEDDRRLGHRLAGDHLEASDDVDAARLAEHFVRGGVPARAARWYRRASEQALEGDDLTLAIALGRRALDTAEDDEVRGVTLAILAEAHKWRGEFALARERGVEALALISRYSAPWFRAASELITACTSHGDVDAAVPHLRMAAEAEVTDAEKIEQVSCVARGCTQLLFVGRVEESDRMIGRVLGPDVDLASLGPSALARVYFLRAVRAMRVEDIGVAVENFEASLRYFESTGQARDACGQRGNLGYTYGELGDFARAEQVLTQVLATAERLGLRQIAGYALQNLSLVLASAGRADEARASAARAAELGREIHDPRLEGTSLSYLSGIALDAGDVDSAVIAGQTAVGTLAQQTLALALARAHLAAALLRAGQPEEARAAIDAAMAFVDSHGGIGEARVRLIYFDVLTAMGEEQLARAAILAARDRLLARATRITNPAWRESFLTRVPDNMRTMRLAEQGEREELTVKAIVEAIE